MTKVKEKEDLLTVDETIWEEAFFGSTTKEKEISQATLIRGYIPKKVEEKVRQEICGKPKMKKKILFLLVRSFWKIFYKWIWCFRCEVFNEWEKANGILTKQKKEKKDKKSTNLEGKKR